MTTQPPPPEARWPKGAVFTVGHSTLPIERFIVLLKTYGIQRLVDIRTVPRSRHNPQFNSDALGEALSAENICSLTDSRGSAACAQRFSQYRLA